MDDPRFDALARALVAVSSRRRLVRALAVAGLGSGLGLGATRLVRAACLPDGAPCVRTGGDPCCSGVCRRKRRGSRKRVCRRAPFQGSCTVERDFCAAPVATNACLDRGTNCVCLVTPGGASVCGTAPVGAATCEVCGSEQVCGRGGGACGGAPPFYCVTPCP